MTTLPFSSQPVKAIWSGPVAVENDNIVIVDGDDDCPRTA